MSEQELKELAESMGYYIYKKPEHKIKLYPCICGAKQLHVRRAGRSRAIACGKCGMQTGYYTDPNKTIPDIENIAREAWNSKILKDSLTLVDIRNRYCDELKEEEA